METNLPSSAVLECMPNRVTAVVFIGVFLDSNGARDEGCPPTLTQANSFRNANDRIAT